MEKRLVTGKHALCSSKPLKTLKQINNRGIQCSKMTVKAKFLRGRKKSLYLKGPDLNQFNQVCPVSSTWLWNHFPSLFKKSSVQPLKVIICILQIRGLEFRYIKAFS